MKRGVFVTGTFLFPNDGTVWRSSLIKVIVAAINGHEGLMELPVFVSLPHEPWIQNAPRPPARLTVSVMQYEWRPHTAEGEYALIAHLAAAVRTWLLECRTEFSTGGPSELLIELSFEHVTLRSYSL